MIVAEVQVYDYDNDSCKYVLGRGNRRLLSVTNFKSPLSFS